MKRISNADFRKHFIAWQCRMRQIAARDYDGRPLPAMMPRVSTRAGEVLLPAMITLLLHRDPREVTNYFRFLALRTNDPQKTRDAAVAFLAADYYQQPELFSDALAAVFPARSDTAAKLVKLKTVLLDFDQFGQAYRMFCGAKIVAATSAARDAALWHNRAFNPNLPDDVSVISFTPDWKTAQADPMSG